MSRVTVLGSANSDLVVQVERLPGPGETMLSPRSPRLGPGGKGANQAVAAARLGAQVRFIAAIGADEDGNRLRRGYEAEGIDLSHLTAMPGESTGLALITIDPSGENTIVVASGANLRLTPEHVDDVELSGGEVLLAQLEIPLETVLAGLRSARQNGATTVVNAAPMLPSLTGTLSQVVQMADVLIVNAVEASQLLALHGHSPQRTPSEQAKALRCLGPQTVIITLGSGGSVALTGDGEVMVQSALQVDAVDSTGAGDAFCAGVATALAYGQTLAQAIELGNAAGAFAVQRIGAQEFGRAGEVRSLLQHEDRPA